jgi:2-polyprenyl-6-methoxyphenol hydroxylase-like FAD-dependent oxidoreductase
MSEAFDAIVIGTEQAGPALAVRLAGNGRKTAIIERKRFGGTCVNVGCIPTKALVASARDAQVARTAADLGVVIDGVTVIEGYGRFADPHLIEFGDRQLEAPEVSLAIQAILERGGINVRLKADACAWKSATMVWPCT